MCGAAALTALLMDSRRTSEGSMLGSKGYLTDCSAPDRSVLGLSWSGAECLVVQGLGSCCKRFEG